MTGKTMNLRHAARDEAGKLVGQGGRADTAQNHIEDDSFQFYLAMSAVQQRTYALLLKATRPVSRLELAKALHLKKTNWFVDNLEQLVKDGYVLRTETHLRNGMVSFWYEVVR